jgi:hypothetical protein
MPTELRVRAGQEYLSCSPPVNRGRTTPARRIRVLEDPAPGWHKADIVTVRSDGREVNPRRIEIGQLHASLTTLRGTPRRVGYYLVASAPGRAAAASASHPRRVRLFGGGYVHAARAATPPEPSEVPAAPASAGDVLFDWSPAAEHRPADASITACDYYLDAGAQNHWLAGTAPVTCPVCVRALGLEVSR